MPASLSRNAYEVLGRALTDATFRAALFQDAKAACVDAGLPLSDGEYQAIGNFDQDTFEGAARDLAGDGTTG